MKTIRLAAIALLLLSMRAYAEEDPALKLKDLESQIAKTPDEPMLAYRKAQCLMKLGKREDGYQTAKDAMALFVKKGDNLSWMMLERIDLGNVRVDVHFNMGPKERKPPEMGIIRPLSFRVWSKKKEAALLEIIDFEIGLFDGKPSTAALGRMTGDGHANFGVLDTDSTYTKIRDRLIDLVRERHKSPKAPEDTARTLADPQR